MTDKFDKIFETIEKIRKDKYPNLDPVLLREIISVERDYEDDRILAGKKISKLISSSIGKVE